MPNCFLIMPFTPESAGDEDPEVFAEVETSIRRAAASNDLAVLRADDIFAPGVIIDQIREAISSADVVVAVCTGRNANVFYELGMADVLGHRPVLVAPSAEHLPFDVSHWRAQFYEDDLDSLEDRVARSLRAALSAGLRTPTAALAAAPSDTDAFAQQARELLNDN
jgi:hypothetical protein